MNATIGLIVAATLSAAVQPARAPVDADDVEVLGFESVEYPQIPHVAGVQGVVVVEVAVAADGTVTKAIALSGPKLLIPAAEGNARRWRVRSAGGRAILVYDFVLGDAACSEDRPLSTFTHRHPTMVSIVGCARML
jgi:hypothetical protein